MKRIHPTAIVDPQAQVGENVEIGPYAVIGPDVRIGDGTVVLAHAVIEGITILGKECKVHQGAILGGPPQDLKYAGGKSITRIGDRTRIRECVTVNRATGDGMETVVGSECLLMAYCHVGHNAALGDRVILANGVSLAGHAELESNVSVGGLSGIHQFVRVGRGAYVGGMAALRGDLLPYSLAAGIPCRPSSVNVVGMRRLGFNREEIEAVKTIHRLIFRSGLTLEEAIQRIENGFENCTNLRDEFCTFIRRSKRNLSRPRGQEGEEEEL